MVKRILWLDVVRVVAIFLMVLLHVSAVYVPLWFEQSLISWWSANIFDSVSRICVPLFFMLSGALLLGKNESIRLFYSKRVKRLIIPWLFWSLIFGVLNLVQHNEAETLKRLVVSTVWTGFWILPVLLVFYLITPPLTLLLKKYGYWFGLSFLFLMGFILLTGIHLPVYFEYSFYFVAGYYLRDVRVTRSLFSFISFVLAIAFFSIMYLTYQLSLANNGFVSTYYHYHTLPVVLASVTAFITLKYVSTRYLSRYSEVIRKLSSVSFAIYFIHLLFFRVGLNFVYFPSYFFIPLVTLLIYISSYGIAVVLKKNRFLSHLIG